MTLFRLDSVIPASVDSFKKITSGSASWEGHNNNSEIVSESDGRDDMEEKTGYSNAKGSCLLMK